MRFLSRFSIAFLLPTAMIVLVMISVGVATFVSYTSESKELMKQAKQTLAALRDERSGRLKHEFDLFSAELVVTASRNATIRTMTSFNRAWRLLDENAEQELQRIYVTENPNPAGERHQLSWPGDNSTYSTIHAQVHSEFRSMLEAYGYYDVFLIDPEGNVVYSAYKEADFATNLLSGPYRDSGLARVFKEAVKAERGTVSFEDYSGYAPSADAPAAFVAHPIIDRHGKHIGVLAYQIPNGPISAVANAPTGAGETGKIYFLGSDKLFRSESYEDGAEPRVGLEEVGIPPVQRALQGETGIMEELGADGKPAVISYSPVDILGERWVVIAEQDTKEIFAGVEDLIKMLVLNGLGIIAAVSVIALLFARSLVNPLAKVSSAMASIAKKTILKKWTVPSAGMKSVAFRAHWSNFGCHCWRQKKLHLKVNFAEPPLVQRLPQS